jgi:hypothetical protein
MSRPLGKRTAKLLQEAILLAHVEGARWAGYHGGVAAGYPKDSEVVGRVLSAAVSFEDLYPTLSKLEEAQAARSQSQQRFVEDVLAGMRHENTTALRT